MLRIAKVKACDLNVDPSYQRDLDVFRVKTMAKEVDLDRIGVLLVSLRKDGSMWVIDGQHRVAMLIEAGMGNTVVQCEVWEGLTVAREAKEFRARNGGRRGVRALNDFKAALKARDPLAVEMNKVVESVGLSVSPDKARRRVCAVHALAWAHKRNGNLADVLSILTTWTDGHQAAYDGRIIKGLSIFLSKYPDADRGQLLRKMAPLTPAQLLIRLKMAGSGMIENWRAACFAFLEIYNTGKGGKKLATIEMVEAASAQAAK